MLLPFFLPSSPPPLYLISLQPLVGRAVSNLYSRVPSPHHLRTLQSPLQHIPNNTTDAATPFLDEPIFPFVVFESDIIRFWIAARRRPFPSLRSRSNARWWWAYRRQSIFIELKHPLFCNMIVSFYSPSKLGLTIQKSPAIAFNLADTAISQLATMASRLPQFSTAMTATPPAQPFFPLVPMQSFPQMIPAHMPTFPPVQPNGMSLMPFSLPQPTVVGGGGARITITKMKWNSGQILLYVSGFHSSGWKPLGGTQIGLCSSLILLLLWSVVSALFSCFFFVSQIYHYSLLQLSCIFLS